MTGMTMDILLSTVNNLQKTAANRNDAAAQVADICRRNKDLLEQKSGELEVVLSHANPDYCSSLFIACLKAMWDMNACKKQDQALNRTADLLKTFLETGTCVRDHIRLVPDLYLPLARDCVLHCLQKRSKPFLAFDIGKAAVEAYTYPGENALTSLTSVTLAAAIKTGQFDEAMNYAYTPIRSIISELHPTQENIDVTSKRSRCAALPFFDSKYMLSYLFYCGLVTAKREKYRLALQFMEMCIGVPGSVASQIQLDALKKYYVLSLIVTEDVNLPQNRSPSLLRILKAKGRLDAYTALTDAVKREGNKAKAVQTVLESKRTHFEQDHNIGLCQILLKSIRKKSILSVAKSYSSIRLSTLAERSHCEQSEVVPYLKSLEALGELTAEIDAANKTVRLAIKEKPTTGEQIVYKIKEVDNMHSELYRLDIVAQMNPSHIIRTLRGVAGQLAMLDDEGLSEAVCPMDT